MQDVIKVVCNCGEEYFSKRALLAARMNRGNQPRCLRCVNQRNAMRLGDDSE
jgi:predicted SprT family Zn-dependent metalloprotease